MKRGSLLQFLGIWASSITSIFTAHALMAKSDIKDLTKTSKKMRPSQSQNATEEGAQDGTPPPQRNCRMCLRTFWTVTRGKRIS